MQRVIKHTVKSLGTNEQNLLKPEDSNLVSSYLLGSNSSFVDQESRLDVSFYKGGTFYNNGEVEESETYIETVKDVHWYSILGVNKRREAQQLAVDPVNACIDAGYGDSDTIVEYSSYNFLFYRGAVLYISDISSDRTEIRAKSLILEDSDIREGAARLYSYLQEQAYSPEAYLDFDGLDQKITVVNSTVEKTVDGHTVLTLKLYEPLPLELGEKSTFEIILPLGDPVRFLVSVQESFVEDPPEQLRGPNYSTEIGTATISTDYLLYKDLLGSGKIYRPFQDNFQVSVDHTNLEDFIHFSSAVERLENAKYKFELIRSYQLERDREETTLTEKDRYNKLIENIIANFDHYEVFLYTENKAPYTWPKDSEGNLLDPTSDEVVRWFEEAYSRAELYDKQNPDILVESVPDTIRDTEESEPYIAFVHMIGQHFDDVWIYLKSLAEKYNADNRLDFGISRDIVKDAIRDFGIDIYESNQNLNKLFELAQNKEFEDKIGDEVSVTNYIEIPEVETVDKDTYNKELYKRIYHNIPALVKMKGTRRGIRVLLNCFGIPDDILDVKVAGGIEIEPTPYFGPQELINSGTIGLLDKVRATNVSTVVDHVNGADIAKNLLSQYRSIQNKDFTRSDDSHQVEIGFDLGKATDEYLKSKLPEFRFDDIFGDPGNREQDYGDIYRNVRENIMGEVDGHFRSPAAIIRLVRYFDVALFRSIVNNFTPARSTVAVGAVVKDNFLHRSRWQGVDVNWIDETYSGSVEVGAVTGSTGGTMDIDTTTSHSLVFSNGIRYFKKDIVDESPKYNGELSGSYIEVTDGWLTEGNPYNKTNPLGLNLIYSFRFMDLPELPYCLVAAWNTIYNWTVFYINTEKSNGVDVDNLNYEGGSKYIATASYQSTLDNSSVQVSVEGIENPETFLGWYKGLNPTRILNRPAQMGTSGSNWLQNSVFYDNLRPINCPSEIQAIYSTADKLRISPEVILESGSYTSGAGDKYVVYLTFGQCDEFGTAKNWDQVGDVEVEVEFNSKLYRGTIPASELLGREAVRFRTTISKDKDSDVEPEIGEYGYLTVGERYLGAYGIVTEAGKRYINADWFDTFGEWSPWTTGEFEDSSTEIEMEIV